jgi:hypothetical protein
MKAEVDFEKYARFLADSGLSEEQIAQMLQDYWNIVCGFVALGWGVSAPDHALSVAELPPKNLWHGPKNSGVSSSDLVSFKHKAAGQSETMSASFQEALQEGVET